MEARKRNPKAWIGFGRKNLNPAHKDLAAGWIPTMTFDLLVEITKGFGAITFTDGAGAFFLTRVSAISPALLFSRLFSFLRGGGGRWRLQLLALHTIKEAPWLDI